MAGNYIKIDRKITEWEWYQNTNTKIVFLHCLLKANWKDGKFEGRQIKRGSFVTSIQKMSHELKVSQQSVRTALEHLKSTGELTIETTNRYSVITVNNYSLYQDINNQANNQLTNNQQTTNKQLTTIEEYKEKKEVKNKNIYSPGLNESIKRIVDYLNLKCGTRYRPNSEKTKGYIKARFNEGFTEQDFFTVIDNKVEEWKGKEQEKYLRPETLFGKEHFESYLNQKNNQPKKSNVNDFEHRDYDFAALNKNLFGGQQ